MKHVMVRRRFFIMMSICLIAFVGCANNEPENDFQRFEPESLAQLMLDAEYERVYAQTSEQFQEQIAYGDLEAIAEEALHDVAVFNVVSTMELNGIRQFTWMDEAGAIGLTAGFSEDDAIEMLLMQPVQSGAEADDTFTETEFMLPFDGEWLVYWGGTNSLANYHYAHPPQRYAYDFVRVQDGWTYEGPAEENESYVAFGAEVLAPAGGTVIRVVDGIADNEPVGTRNEQEPYGNHVIIDHGNGEFSHLAHFRNGTIAVTEGDEVQQGDVLGQTGNSGNSSEAHIHFHVADGPEFSSNSIRIRFAEDAGVQPGGYVQGEYAG